MGGQMAALTDRITDAVEDMRRHLRGILADAADRARDDAAPPLALAAE